MKPIIRLFVFVVLTLVLAFPAYTQKLEAIGQGNGTYNFIIELPKLKAKTKLVPTTPFYKHTILFGDGTFRFFNSGEKGSINHTYGDSQEVGGNYTVRSYSSGAYSDEEDDVPDMKIRIPSPGGLGAATSVEVVDDNRYIKIMRHVEIKPGDTLINVLSVRNPDTTTFSGQLFFFYNGRLSVVNRKNREELPDYSIFNIGEKLFYRPEIGGKTYAYSNLPTALKNQYAKLLLMEIDDLPPGEEVHFFIETEGDASMMDLFDATVKAEMNFGLALNIFDPNRVSLVPDSLRNELASLDLGSFFNSITGEVPPIQADTVTIYEVDTDTTLASQSSYISPNTIFNIVDYYTSTASLVKSHDPNYMRMESCACQEEADLYQVFTTIHCENDGYGETSNIYMDVKLPAGIKASDIVVKPISYHPFGGPGDQISMEILAEDSIRWKLENFGIEGTPIHGVGDPRTYAEVQFNMYSHKDPILLDSVYACIRFDDLSKDPVCTIPVAVSLVGAELSKGVLSCTVGECDDYTPPPPFSFPWWVWLLLILLVMLIFFFRRNS